MTSAPESSSSATLSADDAFAILGEETRLQILQALGEADGPVTFSELFERIEYDDSANYTYHLRQLVGHFVRKTEDGYRLRLAGKRIVEAIYSGVVTDEITVERTPTDHACMYCGNETELAYHDEVVVVYCAACEGRIGKTGLGEDWPVSAEDVVGYVSIPPAGVYGRTPTEILEAAGIWTVADIQSIARDVCPRCAATLDRSVDVCPDHTSGDEFCERCNHQFGVAVDVTCSNCIFGTRSPYPAQALGTVELVAFMTEHGIDPFASNGFHLSSCEEEIVSADPLEARYTFRTDGEELILEIGADLSVSESTRRPVADTE